MSADWVMDTTPTCLHCKVLMSFVRHTQSHEGVARSLFECPSCFKIVPKPVVMSVPGAPAM
jgi:hypothetical protein